MRLPSALLRLCSAALTPLEAMSRFAITSPCTELVEFPAEAALLKLGATNAADPWMPPILIDMTTPGKW
jgi:hypothetical protein